MDCHFRCEYRKNMLHGQINSFFYGKNDDCLRYSSYLCPRMLLSIKIYIKYIYSYFYNLNIILT